MKFGTIIIRDETRKFPKVTWKDGQSCIVGTAKDANSDTMISVIYQDKKQVLPYPYTERDKGKRQPSPHLARTERK